MQKKVLITGITGFLGSFLAKELYGRGYEVYGLARGKRELSAHSRAMAAIKFAYGDEWQDCLAAAFTIFEGDIVSQNLGLKAYQVEVLQNDIDIIFHCAALAELKAEYERIKKINVHGTKNIFEFALACKKDTLKVNHISTMYVVGDKRIAFDETMLAVGQGFHNNYERTKFEAELLVKEYIKKGLNISVFRPSMIVGDSKEGKTSNFRLIYQPLHFFANEIFDVFPSDIDASQNLIHIDSVVEFLGCFVESSEPDIFHVISSNSVTIKMFLETASSFFAFKLPEMVSVKDFEWEVLTPVQIALTKSFVPYFNYGAEFVNTKKNEQELKGYKALSPFGRDNLLKIYGYCKKQGFIK